VNLVEAGEHAGALERCSDKIAHLKEKTEALKKKIKKALFLPGPRCSAVAVIGHGHPADFVIPQFERLFKGFGADLPAFTQFVINMSRWMQDNGLDPADLSSRPRFSSSPLLQAVPPHAAVHRPHVGCQIPVLGPILKKAAIARFARTLSTMFASGVPLVEASEVGGRCDGQHRLPGRRNEDASTRSPPASACSAPWKTPACSRTWSAE